MLSDLTAKSLAKHLIASFFVTPFQPVNILSESCAFSSRRNWLCPRWYLSASLSVGRSPFLICFTLSFTPFNPFQVPEDGR